MMNAIILKKWGVVEQGLFSFRSLLTSTEIQSMTLNVF